MADVRDRVAAVLAVLAALALPGAARAQRVASPAAFARVSGTVYDSLLGAPLQGARVWVRGTSRAGFTDRRGRFALDSVPLGSSVLLFSHPDLDSIGLPAFGAPVTVAADGTPDVQLTVPSLGTARRRLCGAPPPGTPVATVETGVIFGTVTDADADTALAGALVAASWIVPGFEGRRFVVRHPVIRGRSDAEGKYVLCGAPAREVVSLAAGFGVSSTALLEVSAGRRGLVRRDLRLSSDTTRSDSAGLHRGRSAVGGLVTDVQGSPLRAFAVVDNAAGQAETDAAGRFVLAGLPAGSQMLTLRAIGYGAVRMPVELRSGDTVRVTGQLRHITILDTLRVLGASPLVLAAAERARSSTGVVVFGDELSRHPDLAGSMRQLPGLRLGTDAGGVQVYGLATTGLNCLAHIFVDGHRSDDLALAALQPDQVLLLEWYARSFEAPQQYRAQDDCGILLVWTSAMRH